jgi:hypothetical protein
MSRAANHKRTRRKFLQMLSASPLLASPGLLAGSFTHLLAAGEVTEKKFLGWLDSFQQSDEVISSPDQALEVMDFEPQRARPCLQRISAISPPAWTTIERCVPI